MNKLIVRQLGRCAYVPVWQAMQDFTDRRDANSVDELWFVEHDPVFTQGRRGNPDHLLDAGDIDVVETDRGGQVTYHGPGQLVAYTLIDLRRRGLGIRDLVSSLEGAVIELLAESGISAAARADAPGVYVEGQKIASLGLRVRRGASYHGLALNVDMDLDPFRRINPCGYPGLQLTQLRSLGIGQDLHDTSLRLLRFFAGGLGYTDIRHLGQQPDTRTRAAPGNG